MRISDWISDVGSSDLRGCGESGPLPHEMCECRRVKPRNDKGVVAEVARHTNRSSTRPLQHGIEQHVAAGSKVFRRGAFAFVVADAFLAGPEANRRRRPPADVPGVLAGAGTDPHVIVAPCA